MAPYRSSRHLPADWLPDILTRLPVKSLLRFRCVSKPWLALVDKDADFARLHLKTFKNNSDQNRLFVVQAWVDRERECQVRCSDTFEPIPDIISPSEASNWSTVDSIDGLILLSTPSKIGRNCDFRVWNPSIRKFIEIPPLPESEPSTSDVQFHERVIGLGYDPITNAYKLVKLVFMERTLHSAAIYTLGSGKWKIIKFHGNGNGSSACFDWHWEMYWIHTAVYFRSSLYFVARDLRRVKGWDLIWFDLSKEVFFSVSIPDHPYIGSRDYTWWKLLSVDGGLTVEALAMDSTYVYEWAVDNEFMCWKKPRFYSLEGRHISHIKKNGDMLTRRLCSEKVGSYSREREEHKTLKLDIYAPHVSCYVESLILHR